MFSSDQKETQHAIKEIFKTQKKLKKTEKKRELIMEAYVSKKIEELEDIDKSPILSGTNNAKYLADEGFQSYNLESQSRKEMIDKTIPSLLDINYERS